MLRSGYFHKKALPLQPRKVGDYAYKRPEDGVLVVPIGCLKD